MTSPEPCVDIALEGALLDEARCEEDSLRAFGEALVRRLSADDPTVQACLSILLTDDAGIQPLNARWRRKDSPTDVLSFPLRDGDLLGDVVISVQTAVARVGEGTWTLADELAFLLLHGVLHLLGHDHEAADERAVMEAEEQRLWTALGRAGTLREPDPGQAP